MRYFINKKLFYLALLSFLTSVLLVVLSINSSLAKRFPYDMPKEAEEAILQLENALEVDIDTGQIMRPYSEWMSSMLTNGLNSQHQEVKERSLSLLIDLMKQQSIPSSVLELTIRPILEKIQQEANSSMNTKYINLARLARRLSWHIQLDEIPEDSQHLTFLYNNLENLSDGYYYSFAAMDQLVQLGSDEAKQILEKKMREAQNKSMDSGILRKASTSITKITIWQKLQSLSPPDQTVELSNLISFFKDDREFHNKELIIWLLQKLAIVNGQSAKEVLIHIWQDPSYSLDYRSIVEKELVKQGIITTEERTTILDR